jgi:peptidoglycan hydrolase-like protein with peptidoglycan-binding domain
MILGIDCVVSIRTVAPCSQARRDVAFLENGKHDSMTPPGWGNQWFIHQYQGNAIGFPGFPRPGNMNRFRTISRGVVGDHVTWIQRWLRIAESGVFDGATRTAAAAHQRANGLVTDGIVGPKTFSNLCWTG